MATIGSITVAFLADLKGLSTGIEDSLDLFDELKDGIEELSENLSGLSDKKVTVKATVDTDDIAKARSEVDELAKVAEKSSPVIKVKTDKAAVEELGDAIEKTPTEVTLTSSAKEVVKAAAEAAKEVKPLKSGFYIPIKVAYGSIAEARKSITALGSSFSAASQSLLGFNGTVGSSIMAAASVTRAWTAGASAVEVSSAAFGNLNKSLSAVSRAAADEKQLSAAVAEGGSAFIGAAAGATVHAAAMRAVEFATSGLNEPLRESTRFLAELGIGHAQVAVSSRVAEGSANLLRTAIESEVNPLAAVTAFANAYGKGMETLAATSTAATDRQEAFTRGAEVVSGLASTVKKSAESMFSPFISGYAKAREAGQGYFAAISQGIAGQANSFSPVRRAIAALDSAFKASGAASFFGPLTAGFAKARAAGAGFFSATASGISSQLNSLAVFRAVAQAMQSLGATLVRAGGYFVGVNASTKAGRVAFDLFKLSAAALRSTIADVAGYFGVLRTAASAAINALPGGTAIAKALSSSWRDVSGVATKVSSNTQYMTGAVKLAATAFSVAAVAGGQFAHELAHMGAEAQSTRNLADRFGATTQEIEKLKYAASSSGVSISQLAKGQQALFTSLSKIRAGEINTDNVREAKLAFDKLGIGMDELKNKSPQEVFEDIAKKLTAIKDPADRTAIAFDLFGKQGAAILPALKGLGQIEKDVERLDVTTSSLDFSRVEEMNTSFSRLSRATASYAEASLTAYTELQAGFNNFRADVLGGLASLVQNSGSLYADFTKPLAVVLEVTGRVINVILRAAAVVARLVAAFSPFPTTARFAQALGEKIKELIEPLEKLVTIADEVAQSFYKAMTPDYWTGAVEGGKTLNQQLVETTTALGATIVAAGVAQAAMTGLGMKPGAALAKLLGSINITKAGLLSFARTAVMSTLSALKLLVVGLYQTSVNFVASAVTWMATAIAIRAQMIGGWILPSLAAMVSYVTGINATTVATRLAAIGMAASWVIATAGLALIAIAIFAVYQNFDKLKAYFENFSANVSTLFSFEGAAEAAKAVAGAIWNAFKTILNGIGGFVGNVIQTIMAGFAGIKPPEAINATKASADEIVKQREKVAQNRLETQKATQVSFGIFQSDEPVVEKPDDVNALSAAITKARDEMDLLMVESAKFGDTGAKAAEDTASRFDKLQQQLADGVINPAEFEKQSAEIAETLKKNLKLFSEDNAAVARQKNREFFKSLNDLVKQSAKDIREIQSGTVVDGKLFPTSDAIKAESNRVQADYEAELREIQKKRQRGEFGSGEAGEQNAAIAVEEAQRKQKRALDKIGRDTSFADDIRKSLEDAFLTPVGEFEKQMKKIAENKSLSAMEKGQAYAAERKKFVEENFGKTQSETFSERRQAIDKASTKDESGFRIISEGREAVERRKLEADRLSAAGVDSSAGNQMQMGVDRINDAFDVAGKTISEIQATLSPEDFRNYQEAIKTNADAARESVGVERAISDKIAESRRKLAQAYKDGVITEQERNRAARSQRDELLTSLGIQKSPAKEFQEAIEKIKDSASELSPEELATGMKEAKNKLLASFGVDKTPAEQNAEAMKKITEAFKAGQLSLEEFQKAVKKTGEDLDEKLGVKKSPMEVFRKKMTEIDAGYSGEAAKVEAKDPEREKKLADIERRRRKAKEAARANLASELGLEDPSVFGEQIQERMGNLMEAFNMTGTGLLPGGGLDKLKKRLKERFGDNANNPQFMQEQYNAEIAQVREQRKREKGEFARRPGETNDQYKKRTQDAYNRQTGTISDNYQQGADARRRVMQSLPGSSPESPVEVFKREMKKLESVRGSLTGQEFSERKLNLQAQLQEELKPSLDAQKADRRGVEGADVRSKSGVDTFFRILRGNDNPSLKAQLEVARNTKILAEAAMNPDAAPLIAQLPAR